MKTQILISFCILGACFGFKSQSNLNLPDKEKAPVLFYNNFSILVRDGASINCRKIIDMRVIMYLNGEMKKQDLFKIELHRFNAETDVIVAYKSFKPDTKEFMKKFADKDSIKLKLLAPEDDFSTSDFEPNTLIFPATAVTNDVVCEHKEKHYSFYLVIKGYGKTGQVNKFGEALFDNGKEISERSIVFKNWENKTN